MALSAFGGLGRDAWSSSQRTQDASLWSNSGSHSYPWNMGSKCFVGGTHDRLPLFPWFYFSVATFKVTSYTTNEFNAAAASRSILLPKYRVISFSLLISLDLVFNWLWIQENKKKIGSCFPSIVWINWNSSNRSMSNSFHLSGLSFPESNWGGRKGGDLD